MVVVAPPDGKLHIVEQVEIAPPAEHVEKTADIALVPMAFLCFSAFLITASTTAALIGSCLSSTTSPGLFIVTLFFEKIPCFHFPPN